MSRLTRYARHRYQLGIVAPRWTILRESDLEGISVLKEAGIELRFCKLSRITHPL